VRKYPTKFHESTCKSYSHAQLFGFIYFLLKRRKMIYSANDSQRKVTNHVPLFFSHTTQVIRKIKLNCRRWSYMTWIVFILSRHFSSSFLILVQFLQEKLQKRQWLRWWSYWRWRHVVLKKEKLQHGLFRSRPISQDRSNMSRCLKQIS
jgi:hypothetical protein